MTDELKPEDIERPRAVLKPRRERFDFAYTKNRWGQSLRLKLNRRVIRVLSGRVEVR